MTLVLYAASNPAVAQARADTLRREGYEVATAHDSPALESGLRSLAPSAVVLDLPLLGLSGDDLARIVADSSATPPLLVCGPPEAAAAVPPPNRFLAQPYAVDDWIAAVRGLVSAPGAAALSFDESTGTLTVGGRGVHLTPTEARLYAILAAAGGQLVSSEQLVRRLWDYPLDAAAADLLRTHMYQLRQRLARAGLPQLIETLPRRGYRMAPPGG